MTEKELKDIGVKRKFCFLLFYVISV